MTQEEVLTQTRSHKDLDLLIRLEDVGRTIRLVEMQGLTLAYEWPESRRLGGESVPTAPAVISQPP